MFPFSSESNNQPEPARAESATPAMPHPLDDLTGGAFSAATSGERAQRVRDWLATGPDVDSMQAVYRELSAKDKGAARALRDRLEELRREKVQDAMVADWLVRGDALLAVPRLNIADAMAWARDAARAGAPLSRAPLSGLRERLDQRIRAVEDLQQRIMVQVEAAALLVQRIELLSTRGWNEAREARAGLQADLDHWRVQAAAVAVDPNWGSVDLRLPPQLDGAGQQLDAVWGAFVPALEQAAAAAQDGSAPLPPVPVWADELRAMRGEVVAQQERLVTEEQLAQRETALKVVQAGVKLLEHAVASGNTKDMHAATQALRRSLKTHGRLIDDALEARVHAALVSAGELQGWQRWSADKVREDLVRRAEALLVKRRIKGDAPAADTAATPAGEPVDPPLPAQQDGPAAEGPAIPSTPAGAAAPAPSDAAPEQPDGADAAGPAAAAREDPVLERGYEWAPAMDGHKLQAVIRKLRDEWKTADKGGVPNHAMWRRFDRACNAAHRHVELWLEQQRVAEERHQSERLELIDEMRRWTAENTGGEGTDWKKFAHAVRRFAERWRAAGHVPEKTYAVLQPQWKEALAAASAPLDREQKDSRARRDALIAEAQVLGAAPWLDIAAIKNLQARWQVESRSIPLDRRREQKLWDAFRKPLDEAFRRKDAERETRRAAMHAHDRAVLDAAQALEQANASGDASRIREAMDALAAATRGLDAATVRRPAPDRAERAPAVAPGVATSSPEEKGTGDGSVRDRAVGEAIASSETPGSGPAAGPREPELARPVRPLVAVRGDDRPQARKPAGGSRDDRERGRERGRPGPRVGPGRGSDDHAGRGRRLGDSAFRAQREAVENAQSALRRLAAQAHGEALTRLLEAWQRRDVAQVPEAREFGRAVTPAVLKEWLRVTENRDPQRADQAATALLRLEVAAEVPSPADCLDARRALKLQLLTQRNDPSPAETWEHDVAAVLASAHDEHKERRLQKAVEVLLRKGRTQAG